MSQKMQANANRPGTPHACEHDKTPACYAPPKCRSAEISALEAQVEAPQDKITQLVNAATEERAAHRKEVEALQRENAAIKDQFYEHYESTIRQLKLENEGMEASIQAQKTRRIQAGMGAINVEYSTATPIDEATQPAPQEGK